MFSIGIGIGSGLEIGGGISIGGGSSGGGVGDAFTDDHEALHVADLDDIQAGPIIAVPTKAKLFLFFTIKDVNSFRLWFRTTILPKITTSRGARNMRQNALVAKLASNLHPLASLTVSFSQKGLNKVLGQSADTRDPVFAAGQFADATDLGDTLDDWRKEFQQGIDGLFEIISTDVQSCQRAALELGPGINGAITIQFVHIGQVRPGDQKDHEHFGFNDGISQPFVKIEDDRGQNRKPHPGQMVVNPGVLLLGRTGDQTARPDWARNGSFLAYRQLKQLVPEFNAFLRQIALSLLFIGPLSDENRLQKMADYVGARLMGRWKSGCPVVLTPFQPGRIPEDIPQIGRDPERNNKFDFGPRDQTPRRQGLCPFAAHVRKMGPRTDLPQDSTEQHAIMRSGITYGQEVTDLEKTVEATLFERGLAFLCYQSDLASGFQFIQKLWSNNVDFPFNTDAKPGFDPIIGQASGAAREMTGYDASDTSKKLPLPQEFVIAEGGEYLFLPSITTLRKIAGNACGKLGYVNSDACVL